MDKFKEMSQEDFNFYVASYLYQSKVDIDKSLKLAQISNPLYSIYGGKSNKKNCKTITSSK